VNLTPKQEAFCLAYMANGGNATAAYKASYNAGNMAEKTIWEKASTLLADGKVSARIDAVRNAAAKVAIISEARLLTEVWRIAMSDPRALFDAAGKMIEIHELPDAVAASIASIKINEINGKDGVVIGYTKEVKFWDKNSAAEKLMKHMGSFEKDNRQRTGVFDAIDPEEALAIRDWLSGLSRTATKRAEALAAVDTAPPR
jgi:phage terminase small subunit